VRPPCGSLPVGCGFAAHHARLPDDEHRLEHRLLVPVPLPALVQQQLRGPPAELLPRLAHRAQRHGGGRGEVDVVVPHDGELGGHPDPVAHHLLQHAQGQQVVGADGGRGTARGRQADDPGGGLAPAGDAELAGGQDGQLGVGHLAHGRRHARVALLHLGQRGVPADEGDPPVPALEQVLGGQPPAEDVVGRDGALVRARCPPVDQHDRDAAVAQRVQLRGQLGGRGDEDAVHPLLGEQAQVRGLLLRPVVGVAQDQRQAGGVDDVLDPAGDVGEERVGDVEHHQADGAAGAGAQLSRRLVAHEAEGRDRVEHPRAGGLADHVGPVEDVAHRADRHPGPAGDVADARGQVPSSVEVQCPAPHRPTQRETSQTAVRPLGERRRT
jgi:hypothetical protein